MLSPSVKRNLTQFIQTNQILRLKFKNNFGGY